MTTRIGWSVHTGSAAMAAADARDNAIGARLMFCRAGGGRLQVTFHDDNGRTVELDISPEETAHIQKALGDAK